MVSRYGEYLALTNAANSEDYLPSTLELQPESADAYQQLGAWYGDRGKLSEALDQYSSALQLRPGNAMIYDQMALLLWKQGRKTEALDAWAKAITLVVKEIDERKVPESFWPDFAAIVGHLGSRGQFSPVRPQVDAMLRTYIRRNGSYMTEPLLHAVYTADANATDPTAWILDLAAVGNPPDAVLESIVDARWIPNAQRPRIYARLVEVARANSASSEGEARTQAENRLRQLEIQWFESLINVSDYGAAKQQLESIPADEKKSHQPEWLPLEMKIAAHDGTLKTMVDQWMRDPSVAPPAELLRNAATGLDAASKNLVLAFVYQNAIDAHDLSATNFLGLAEIRIADGDISGAIALLNRMVLVSSDQYADLDSAAGLLTRTGHDAEAIPFLTQLTAGVPWQPAYRLRLDTATLKANQGSAATLDDLSAVAKNASAPYEIRAQAAQALAGRRAVANLGSRELDLLTQSTISPADAQRPYFLPARIVAAKSAPLPQRTLLLREAIEIAPQNNAVRLALLHATLEAKAGHLAINTAAPFLGQTSYAGQDYEGPEISDADQNAAEEDTQIEPAANVYDPGAYPAYGANQETFFSLPRSERAVILAGVAQSYRQIGEAGPALSTFLQALPLEVDPARRKYIAASIAELRREIARRATNVQRAPQIHESLDQNHAVRPRLQAYAERKQP